MAQVLPEAAYCFTLEAAAQEAYDRLWYPHLDLPPHVWPRCMDVTGVMLDRLVDFPLERRRVPGPATNSWDYHYYLFDGDRQLVIDPTWQQFLTVPVDEFPRVLILPPSEMAAWCSGLDIDPDYAGLWNGELPGRVV